MMVDPYIELLRSAEREVSIPDLFSMVEAA